MGMNFAAIVHDARTTSGLSQSDLAAKACIGIATLWRIEKDGDGTIDVLTEICRALDLRFTGLPRAGSFGDQVQVLRTRRGWTQSQLAERIGVSVGSITRLETGNARIKTLSAAFAALAPKARIRKAEIPHWGVGASRDERLTPPDLLDKIINVIGSIDLDPCAHPQSKIQASTSYYAEDDGLAQPWRACTIYINPPYSSAAAFMRKANQTWKAGHCKTVLALLQVQMHHHWVHEYLAGQADIFFLRGRIAFDRIGKPRNPAPFGNMIVIFGADERMIQRMLTMFDCVHLPRGARVGKT
jgi:transcriptional regulator with XRE-family HTH domain